jgi:hypothetical protein
MFRNVITHPVVGLAVALVLLAISVVRLVDVVSSAPAATPSVSRPTAPVEPGWVVAPCLPTTPNEPCDTTWMPATVFGTSGSTPAVRIVG